MWHLDARWRQRKKVPIKVCVYKGGEIKWRRVKVSGLSNRCWEKWDKKACEEQPLYILRIAVTSQVFLFLFASGVKETEKKSVV